MADNPVLVALLIEFMHEASVTRTEAGKIVGKTRGQIAGTCHRSGIAPWPRIPLDIKEKRSCQFPVGSPESDEFHLCGRMKASGHSFLCDEHQHVRWIPTAKVLKFGT